MSFGQADYDAVDHGYATTIHKSQGATVDRAFVLASAGMDRHLAYVALTRHRDGVGLYAPQDTFADFAALAARLSRAGLKETVLDYVRVPARAEARVVRAPELAPVAPTEPVAAAVTSSLSEAFLSRANEPLPDRVRAALAAPVNGLLPLLPGVYEGREWFERRVIRAVLERPEVEAARVRLADPAEAMVKDPLGLRRAIRALLDRSRALTETPAVFLKRAEAEVDNPERYGGLRGKIGLFVFPAARAERARALAAVPELKAGLAELKSVFDAAVVLETERERTRCAAIRIPIPGLSPGTRTALRLFVGADGSAPATLDALAALRAEPSGVAEVEAVRLALDQRFGTAADRFKDGGGRDQGVYTPFGAEVQALIRGVEAYGSALRLEPDLRARVERTRQAEAERALKPALEPKRAVEIERKPAPGLGLGLGF